MCVQRKMNPPRQLWGWDGDSEHKISGAFGRISCTIIGAILEIRNGWADPPIISYVKLAMGGLAWLAPLHPFKCCSLYFRKYQGSKRSSRGEFQRLPYSLLPIENSEMSGLGSWTLWSLRCRLHIRNLRNCIVLPYKLLVCYIMYNGGVRISFAI